MLELLVATVTEVALVRFSISEVSLSSSCSFLTFLQHLFFGRHVIGPQAAGRTNCSNNRNHPGTPIFLLTHARG